MHTEGLLSGAEKVSIGRFEFTFEAVAAAGLPARAPTGTLNGVEIESRTLVIGSRNSCEIVIPDEGVASAHALVLEIKGRRFVRDLTGLSNGLLVNGRPVQ